MRASCNSDLNLSQSRSWKWDCSLELKLEWWLPTWLDIKIIRVWLAFYTRNVGYCWVGPGFMTWAVRAASCWHRFALNISHYFSFNDGMQWKKDSWNVCLHASLCRAVPHRYIFFDFSRIFFCLFNLRTARFFFVAVIANEVVVIAVSVAVAVAFVAA